MSKLWLFAVAVWVAALPARVDAQFFDEKFDTYANGSMISGQGGWTTWDNDPNVNTTVVNTQSFSAPNSLLITGISDIVHTFTGATGGVWFTRVFVRIPSTQTGESWVILLNTYAAGVHNLPDWSSQVVFCRTGCTTAGVVAGMVTTIGGGEVMHIATTPLIMDQFVELRVRVDLAANQYQLFYNGVLFETQPWVVAAPLRIQAIDLYSNASSNTFMDNVWLDPTLPVEGMSFTVE
jgi:hypothetical protein